MTVEEYLQKHNPSKVTLELIERLFDYSHEDDYILGVLAESPYDCDRQLILDYINNGKDVDYSNILLFSLEVGIEREKIERQNKSNKEAYYEQ